ncbi:MAG: hypothetical protein DMG30_11430 [Acidobacteria bacterium]|nr:MAG: hypothetical protein DMG30_11430 [Acidobacteriota bacterium]
MMRMIIKSWLVAAVFASIFTVTVWADEVTDWNQNMFTAAHIAGTSPLIMGRVAAIVQASVFDAVNGIERLHSNPR